MEKKTVKIATGVMLFLDAAAAAQDTYLYVKGQPVTMDHALVVAASSTANDTGTSMGWFVSGPILAVNVPPMEPIKLAPLKVKISKDT